MTVKGNTKGKISSLGGSDSIKHCTTVKRITYYNAPVKGSGYLEVKEWKYRMGDQYNLVTSN